MQQETPAYLCGRRTYAFLWAIPSAQVRDATIVGAPALQIDHLGRVTDQCYRGSQPSDRDYASLAAVGIKTVSDLQADGLSNEPARVEAAG